MGKNKKQARNAFFFFMLDVKNRQGRSYKSMADVQEEAGQLWTRMSADQKKPYEERARQEKQATKEVKLTSTGLNVDNILKREYEEREKEQHLKQKIQKTLQMLRQTDKLAEYKFFMIHFNIFCKCESKLRCYPAEVAISCFSLIDGVLPDNVFHKIINSAPFPLGYRSEVKRISEETHQIPCSDDEPNNLEEVFTEMMEFLKKKSNDGQIPPLLVREQDLVLTNEILQQFSDEFCDRYNNLFEVQSLEYFLWVLRNLVTPETEAVWPFVSLSKLELERDVWDFTLNIACDFHKALESPIFCSKSIVTRMPYIVCDNCCGDLGIELIPGQHVPVKARLPEPELSDSACSMNYGFRSNNSTTNSVSDRSEFSAWGSDDSKADGWQEVRHKTNQPMSYANAAGPSQISFGRSRRPVELPTALKNARGRGRNIVGQTKTN